MLCPARKNKDGSPAGPTEFKLNSIRNDANELKEKRKRFWSRSVRLCVEKQVIAERRTKAFC